MFNVKRILAAGGYSLNGFKFLIRNEAAFKDDLLIFAILAPIDLYLGDNLIEKLIPISSLIILLITETLNTCIEKTIDLITKERNELAGAVKDMGSFAVLCSLILVLIAHLIHI